MTALYRLFDAKDELLYIGIANRWTSRLGNHAHDKPWWPEVAKTTIEHLPTREAALAVEEQAIRAEHPRHNVMHNGERPKSFSSVSKSPGLQWACSICHKPIADNDGYLEVRFQIPTTNTTCWWFVHRPCDPNPSRDSYWIGIERLRHATKGEDSVQSWIRHLNGKTWFDEERFLDALYEASLQPIGRLWA